MATPQKTEIYYVSKLAGRKVAGKRVAAGDAVSLTEKQARAELLAGALATEKSRIDDPFGEKAAPVPAKAPASEAPPLALPPNSAV